MPVTQHRRHVTLRKLLSHLFGDTHVHFASSTHVCLTPSLHCIINPSHGVSVTLTNYSWTCRSSMLVSVTMVTWMSEVPKLEKVGFPELTISGLTCKNKMHRGGSSFRRSRTSNLGVCGNRGETPESAKKRGPRKYKFMLHRGAF